MIDTVNKLLPEKIRHILNMENIDYSKVYEIRLRVGRPIFVKYIEGESFIKPKGFEEYILSEEDLKETLFHLVPKFRLPKKEKDRLGVIYLEGGHRAVINGKAIISQSEIKSLKSLSCIELRLSQEKKGFGDYALRKISSRTGVLNTLIIGEPSTGKTTLLRDLVRQISKSGVKIGVVDENNELTGSFLGVPQKEIGENTSVIRGSLPILGVPILLKERPQVIAIDEIKTENDLKAIKKAIDGGCNIICTVSHSTYNDYIRDGFFNSLHENKTFKKYLCLGKDNEDFVIKEVYNEKGFLEYT